MASGGTPELVAGCPPCQGFSSIRTRNGRICTRDADNDLVFEFLRLVTEIQPPLVMMENVPGLATDGRLHQMITRLTKLGYRARVAVLDAQHFGLPQRRRRMILAASIHSHPRLAQASQYAHSVHYAIGHLPSPADSQDELHNYPVRRSFAVMQRIKHTPKDGGSRAQLPKQYELACHRRISGFKDVYGRMAWNRPAPTITGGCINPSKGRFIHPDQDRAITLREAAILQGFPLNYSFDLSRGRYRAAELIGNAFPPVFAQKHATALLTQYTTYNHASALSSKPLYRNRPPRE